LPSRSRKLLPRLVSAAPDDTVELITVGVGLGVGEGVGVGMGVGVGDCACAADVMPMRTNAIATSRASAWPILIFRARESRDEQRIQSIPKGKSAGSKNAQNLINRSDLPPVRPKGQSVGPQAGRRIRIIVVRQPQLARHYANVSGSRQTLRAPALAFRQQPGSPRPRRVPDRIARSSGRHSAANCHGLQPPAADPIRTADKSHLPRRRTSWRRYRPACCP
jgi:hypothetical protein